MNESTNSSTKNTIGFQIMLAACWILSLLLTGFLSYGYGKTNAQNPQKAEEKVLNAQTNEVASLKDPSGGSEQTTTPVQSTNLQAETTVENTAASGTTNTCSKNGFAQKWEYLTAYTVKANDTLESVATEQLKDASRVNELLKLNGVGPYVVGSTLYLPPSSIPKSSGNIRQVYGKLVDKNDTSWHISFSTDKKGQGLLIPAFLFDSVANKASFSVGDCISVLFDDGYKIYTLALQ